MNQRHIAGAAGPPECKYDADVIILSLDRPEETAAAVLSALAQIGVTRHVIVVDQGSRPENLARLGRLIGNRADATLVALDGNAGVAGGRNRATALGRGRVIFGLDNDAEFATSTTLARAVAELDHDATLAAIGCRIKLFDQDADDVSSWGYPASLLPMAGACFDAATFVGAGHAIRRAAWYGYDESLFFCWEEFDFCLNAIDRGWRIRYCGDIVVRHKVSAERRVTWSSTRWYQFVRNRIYIARKWHASWVALLPLMAFYLLRGARNGALTQTVRAIRAAATLSATIAPHRPSPTLRRYLRINDAAHRCRLAMLWQACWEGWGDPRSAATVARGVRATAAAGSLASR